MKREKLRVAVGQYPLLAHRTFNEWHKHVAAWIEQAARAGAKLLVLPEFCSMDLAAIDPENERASANELITNIQKHREAFRQTFLALAQSYAVYIVSGSLPCLVEEKYFNRSMLFSPSGKTGYQDKMMLTRFERERTFLSAGEQLTLFETEFGLWAIAICYDVEFPMVIRRLAETGCTLLIVPSCTGSVAGYNRIRIGCQARALENQMPVIQSSTIGDAPWQPIADTNHGAAGVFGPPDHGFPETGIISIGLLDQPAWVYGDVDFEAYENVRENGHVLNWKHWDEQGVQLVRPMRKVSF